jgi:WD40 repeat protein
MAGNEGCALEMELSGQTATVRYSAWSPDGTRIASASDDGTVRVWDVGGGRVVAKLQGHGGPDVTSCAWCPDGASTSYDMPVRVWLAPAVTPVLTDDHANSANLGGGRVVAKLEGHLRDHPVTSCAWNPEASVSADRTLLVWDGGDAREVVSVEAGAYTRPLFSST